MCAAGLVLVWVELTVILLIAGVLSDTFILERRITHFRALSVSMVMAAVRVDGPLAIIPVVESLFTANVVSSPSMETTEAL